MANTQKLISANIRMYRQGFGDCFLISFEYENPSDVKYIMIDFGVLMGSKKKGGTEKNDTMKKIAKDIITKTKGQIDVLAVTHEHWDHFSGFTKNQARDIISGLNAKEIWLAWTEKETHQDAIELKTRKKNIQENISKGLKKLEEDSNRLKAKDITSNRLKDALGKRVENIEHLLAFEEEKLSATNSSITEKTVKEKEKNTGLMNILRNVWSDVDSRTAFHESGKIVDLDWGGVRIYILGPPPEWDYLRKNESNVQGDLYLSEKILEMSSDINFNNPNTFMNSYLFADKDRQNDWSDKDIPFDEHWALYKVIENTNEIELQKLENQALREGEQERIIANIKSSKAFNTYISKEGAKEKARKDLNEIRRIDNDYLSYLEPLAMKLNSHTNNTSLVLAIELIDSGKVLLFPGDAQYGNWISWTEKNWVWEVPNELSKKDKKKKIRVEDLLARTAFYKVSHHGSHNGTPQDRGLELMKDKNLIAAVPVNESDAQDRNWYKIPYNNIMRRLQEKVKVIDGRPAILRSDIDFVSSGEITADESKDKLYFDITIKNK